MKKLIIGLFTVVSLVVLSACGSNTLNGDYTGTFSLLGMESPITMRFDGDTVYDIQEGEETNTGTYEIDDDELIMTIDEYTVNADLSDDRESFTVTSADGLVAMLSGVTFTKED
ncbi:hypothetical protein [Marinilactibacillus psychrotolerans]|uniref:hypothetical protein n=1 Tax=Marinilactibacillus psychrotolerans TaxID=191770 RepID=UPI00388A86CC